MGRLKGSAQHRYGPPGAMPPDKEYQAHYRFCVKLGRRIPWEEYLSRKMTVNYHPGRFGPPGSKANDLASRRHRQYCYYFRKYFTWTEYQARIRGPKKPRNMEENLRNNSLTPESIAARVAANRAKLREKGLLK